ncbi:MAG: 6-phosphogluconolactonase [Acidobacteriaceae bacterium]
MEIYSSSRAAGEAAAQAAAATLKQLGRNAGSIGVIFATGASQIETLQALTSTPDLPWERVIGFHMDEYENMDADHPASFRGYLRKRLTSRVALKEFNEIDGSVSDLDQLCRDYMNKLRLANPQLCLLGIGENGHLAFNDPPVADFNDPLDVKLVELDAECRQQQLAEGWFKSLEEIPNRAVTLTIPALLRVPRLIVSVPGPRKAKIVRRALVESISTDCPATILRTHPNATLYLDAESSAQIEDL